MSGTLNFGQVIKDQFANAAVRISSYLNPLYKPSVLFDGGATVADKINGEYLESRALGESATADLVDDMLNEKTSVRQSDAIKNILMVSEKLDLVLKNGDPDAIAVELMNLFCIGLPEMDVLDNQRRIVSVWSAILAPNVVLRVKDGRAIDIDDIVSAGMEWVRGGFTEAAHTTYISRDTRFISAHPARMYQLIADSAQQFKLDHGRLLESMISPVVLGMGYHCGAAAAAKRCEAKATS